MVSQKLIDYIKRNLNFGEGKVREALLKEGYPQDLVNDAIKAAVESNSMGKKYGKREEGEGIGNINNINEKTEQRKEQLGVKKEEIKKKDNELNKKEEKGLRNNSKILIAILITIIILGAGFFIFYNFFTEKPSGIKEDDSLVLDLNFENTPSIKDGLTYVTDSSKYGNDGILKGDANIVDTDFGKALELSGAGYVEVNDDDSLDISDEITIMAWIYHKGGNTQLIVGNGGGWGYNGYHILFYNNKVRFELQDTGRKEYSIGDSTTVSDNEWHHVVATWGTSDNIMHIYIDGIETNTTTFTGPIGDSNVSLGIGYGFYSTYGGNYFNGTIYQVKIYDRSLSQSEISYLYNKGRK